MATISSRSGASARRLATSFATWAGDLMFRVPSSSSRSNRITPPSPSSAIARAIGSSGAMARPRNPTTSRRAIRSRSRFWGGRRDRGCRRFEGGRRGGPRAGGGRRRRGSQCRGGRRARGEREPAGAERGSAHEGPAREPPLRRHAAERPTNVVVRRDQRVAEDVRGDAARRSAAQAAVMRTHSGSFRPRGAPGGDRNGASVSTSRRSAGTIATTSAVASSPARNASPENEIASPRSSTCRAYSREPENEWITAGGRSAPKTLAAPCPPNPAA